MRAATTIRSGPVHRAKRRPPGRLDSHRNRTDRRGLVTTGTAKVSNQNGWHQTTHQGPNSAHYMMGTFVYYTQQWHQGGQGTNKYRDVPGPWVGDRYNGASTAQYDSTSSSEYSRAQANGWVIDEPAGDSAGRDSGAATTYGSGVTLGFKGFSVSLSAETDYQKTASYTWRAGTGRAHHWLYGSNDIPSQAHIIYTG